MGTHKVLPFTAPFGPHYLQKGASACISLRLRSASHRAWAHTLESSGKKEAAFGKSPKAASLRYFVCRYDTRETRLCRQSLRHSNAP